MHLRTSQHWIRDIWAIIGVTFALLIIVELLASAVLGLRDSGRQVFDPRAHADSYAGATWAPAYFDELAKSSATRWTPFVYWRRVPFSGAFITVDSVGLRATSASSLRQAESGTRPKIYLFGGSTMWGTGARDAHTIPSELQRLLETEGFDVDVVNLGESGYVSTQIVIELFLRLRRGERPSLVILYDGVNDTFSSFQNGVAGIPQNESNRIAEFNLMQPERASERRMLVLLDFARNRAVVRLARRLVAPRSVATGDVAPAPVDLTLARSTVAIYLENIRLARALGSQYGFELLAYWQPTILQKRHLTKYEESERTKIAAYAPFVESTYGFLRTSTAMDSASSFVTDVSDIFESVEEPLFIDWMHLSERGNALIAERLGVDVLRSLREVTPGS